MLTLPVLLQEHLKHYVYVYLHPEHRRVVYIGRGTGNRVWDHLYEADNIRLREVIETYGVDQVRPHIYIVRSCLTEKEAEVAEAACIDLALLLGHDPANAVRGSGAVDNGLTSLDELVLRFTPEPLVAHHRLVTFNLRQAYRYDIHPEELYEYTRGVWIINPEGKGLEFALAVFDGIVREVYEIEAWYPAGTLPYTRRTLDERDLTGRHEFSGKVASPEIRRLYLGKHIPSAKRSQNPVKYWP